MSNVLMLGAVCFLAASLGGGAVYADETVRQIDRDRLFALIQKPGPVVVVDVRNIEAYLDRHIPGAVSLPFPQLAQAAWPKDTPLVVYCFSAGCHLSHESALVLMRQGYKDVRDFNGGMLQWESQGLPVARGAAAGTARAGDMPPEELWKRIRPEAKPDCGGCVSDGGGITVLDLRPPDEFAAGHVPGARSLPLESLARSTGTLSRIGDIVVYDAAPARSREGAKVLRAVGLHVRILDGGLSGWGARPLDKGTGH
ncbi:MAG: rhodanese-like domain-containing protein [Elusimicrobiota bacterium]|jgi:rhodanese-related sulfurtransferase